MVLGNIIQLSYHSQIHWWNTKHVIMSCVYLDLSKAFDTIKYAYIIERPLNYGITGLPQQWSVATIYHLLNRYFFWCPPRFHFSAIVISTSFQQCCKCYLIAILWNMLMHCSFLSTYRIKYIDIGKIQHILNIIPNERL